METSFEYVFPAIRGVQAGREYYVSMCPLRLIPKIFLFDDEELVPELRAQRILNHARIPEMTRYLLENREDYVFSALTASIDGPLRFQPIGSEGESNRVGAIHVGMESRFIINDGQHRRKAIEEALRRDPSLADETIAVVFFLDRNLERCQQMFADLNRYAVRPSRSLGLLYDHRNDMAQVAKLVAMQSESFKDVAELEKTTLSQRSRKLFTLSAIYTACCALLGTENPESVEEATAVCKDYWDEVGKHIPEWRFVRESKMTAGEVRRDFVHSHSIVLQALGEVGRRLIVAQEARDWRNRLKALDDLDWSRSNTRVWEGRAMTGGRIQKASHNVTLTANLLKKRLGLDLTPEEQRAEDAFSRGEHAS